MADAKQITQGALDMLGTVAFAIPGLEPLAALFGIVSFALGFIPDDPGPPPPPPVTEADLAAALADLKKDIVDALWDNRLDDGQDGLLANKHQFDSVWSSLTGKPGAAGKSPAGPEYDLDSSLLCNLPSSVYSEETYEYFNTAAQNAIWVKLVAFRTMLEFGGAGITGVATAEQVVAHQRRTTGLYCLAGSLLVSYLKAAVIWHWANTLAKNRRIAKFNDETTQWENLTPLERATKKKADPKSDPLIKYQDLIDPRTGKVVAPISWAEFSAVEVGPVQLLRDQVRQMLNYCVETPAISGLPAKDGLYTSMHKLWEALDTEMSSYSPATGTDPSTMKWSELQQAVNQGYQRAAIWAHDCKSTRDQAQGDLQDLVPFAEAILRWRTVAASVSFQEHTVKAGDTLAALATHYYKDSTRANDIFLANADIIADVNTVGVGQVLRIYDPDVLAYAPRPKPAAAGKGN